MLCIHGSNCCVPIYPLSTNFNDATASDHGARFGLVVRESVYHAFDPGTIPVAT